MNKSLSIRISVPILRDDDFSQMRSIYGDAAFKAFGQFVAVIAHLRDIRSETGTTKLTVKSLSKKLETTPKSIRHSVGIIGESCEALGTTPWMIETEDGRIHVPNYARYQWTPDADGESDKPPDGPDPKRIQNGNAIGTRYEYPGSLSEGGCGGKPGEPAPGVRDWNTVTARYAGTLRDHPFNAAWEAWPKQTKPVLARAAWDKAVIEHGVITAERLLERILAYTESKISKDKAGTEYHPPLHDWIGNGQYDDDESVWNPRDGRPSAKSERDALTHESPEQRELRVR